MSSPARRSTRSSRQTPSSPAPGPSNAAQDASQTPRRTRASQLASSPMFYDQSSPADNNPAPSSPLRQMSNSQSTNNGPTPSSPLRQQSETQSVNDGDRTPRASGLAIGGMSYLLEYNAQNGPLTEPKSLHLSVMIPALAPAPVTPRQTYEAKAVVSSWTQLESLLDQDVVISTPSTQTKHPYLRAVLCWVRTEE